MRREYFDFFSKNTFILLVHDYTRTKSVDKGGAGIEQLQQ